MGKHSDAIRIRDLLELAATFTQPGKDGNVLQTTFSKLISVMRLASLLMSTAGPEMFSKRLSLIHS